MLYEILRETPIYQEMTRRSHEEGKVEESQNAFLLIVENKFPQLSSLATELVAMLYDVNIINGLMVKVSIIQDIHEAEVLLLEELKKRK